VKIKVGITGANGYIGCNLVKFLLKENKYDLTVLIHKNDHNLIGLDVKKVKGSVLDKDSLDNFTNDIDILIHLASVQSTIAAEKEFENVIFKGASNIIESCQNNQVKKIINISTIRSLLDEVDHSKILTENSPLAINEKDIPFDMWSAKADHLFLKKKNNIHSICLHLGTVIGPEDSIISPMGNFFISYLKGHLKVVPTGGYPWISIYDVLHLIEKLLLKTPKENQYILAKEWISLNDILLLFKNHSGILKKYKIISTKKLLLLGGLLNPIFKILKLKLIPTKTLLAMTRHKNFSSERIKKEFNYELKSINKTLKECADWYSSQL
jgi:nucleoside-diphosphate-sugar epimerase